MDNKISLDLFGNEIPPKKSKRTDCGRIYKRKIDLATLESVLVSVPTVEPLGIPSLAPNNFTEIPKHFVGFSNINGIVDLGTICCHFYEADYRFVRVLDLPDKYIPMLKKCMYVVAPDFSQRIGWAKFACFANSCWNKAIGAYWQMSGVRVLPNLTWTVKSSYDYSLAGIPQGGMVAINSTGCQKSDHSKYIWRKGYEFLVKNIAPSSILRYGPKMPYEDESISHYYVSEHLNRMHHGR